MDQLPTEAKDAIVSYLYEEHSDYNTFEGRESIGLKSMSALCLTSTSLRDITLPWLYRSFNGVSMDPYAIKLFARTLLENQSRALLVRDLTIHPYDGSMEDDQSEPKNAWKPNRAQLVAIGKLISPLDETARLHVSRSAKNNCCTTYQLLLLALTTRIRTLGLGLYERAGALDDDDIESKCCGHCPDFQILVPLLLTHHPTNGPQGNAYARLSEVTINGASESLWSSFGVLSRTLISFMYLPSVRKLQCSHATASTNGKPLQVLSGTTQFHLQDARGLTVDGLMGLLSSIKALEDLKVQRRENDPEAWYHIGGPQLKSALTTQQHSLRHLNLTVLRSKLAMDRDKGIPIGSLRDFAKLETLAIDEYMLVGSKDPGSAWGHLYPNELFPESLKQLEINSLSQFSVLPAILLCMSRYTPFALTNFQVHFLDRETRHSMARYRGRLTLGETYSFHFGSWICNNSLTFHCWKTPNMREWFENILKRIRGGAKRACPELLKEVKFGNWREEMALDVIVGLIHPLLVADTHHHQQPALSTQDNGGGVDA